MNGIELFEGIKQVSTFAELLQSVNGKTKAETQSKHGNLIEKIWDYVIKFGFVAILSNDEYDHYEGNINTCKLKKVDNGTSNKVTEVSVVNIEESNIQPGANKMTTNDVNERSFNRYESPNT